MSGLEIVGVVLGALPLLIQGLQQYRGGLDSLQTALHYREVIADLIITFVAVTAGYQTVCQRVMRPLMLANETYTELLDDPMSAKWCDAEIDTGIKQYLGVNYNPFLDVVARLHRNILKFSSRLDLDPDNAMTPRWLLSDNKASFRQRLANRSNKLFKSINIGLESGKLEAQLQKIEVDLKLLERMIPEDSAAPEVTRKATSRTRLIWKDTREGAKQMFEAMSSALVCNSQHSHVATLQLRPRDDSSSNEQSRFKLVLSVEHESIATDPSLLLCSAIEVESTKSFPTSTTAGLRTGPTQSNDRKTGTKRVTISAITTSYQSSTVTITKSPSDSASPVRPKVQLINDLCQCLQSSKDFNGCLGSIEWQSWHHRIYKTSRDLLKPTWLRLQEMIITKQGDQAAILANKNTPPLQLSLKERYHLYYVLAMSCLQFADTPWLSSNLTLRDLYFSHHKSLEPQNYPYIRNQFNSKLQARSDDQPPQNRLISNQTTYALGVLLIELSYDRLIESLVQKEDLDAGGNTTSVTEQLTVNRLLDDVRTRQGDSFADAVQRCIRGSFSSADSSFDNPNLQVQFYEGVVAPLKRIFDAL